VKACPGSALWTTYSNGACSRLDIRSGTLQSYARILPKPNFKIKKTKMATVTFWQP
jgi:hypothetical protein